MPDLAIGLVAFMVGILAGTQIARVFVPRGCLSHIIFFAVMVVVFLIIGFGSPVIGLWGAVGTIIGLFVRLLGR